MLESIIQTLLKHVELLATHIDLMLELLILVREYLLLLTEIVHEIEAFLLLGTFGQLTSIELRFVTHC